MYVIQLLTVIYDGDDLLIAMPQFKYLYPSIIIKMEDYMANITTSNPFGCTNKFFFKVYALFHIKRF
jgi:hypothetical protein